MGSGNSKEYKTNKIIYKERPKDESKEKKEKEKENEIDDEKKEEKEIDNEIKDEENIKKEEDENIKKEEVELENGRNEEIILRNEKKNSEKQNGKMITVVIPLNYGCWENKYNIETPLNKVASDFQSDNNMNSIQKNHYIEFSFKNEPLEMNSHPLKDLIHGDMNTIHIAQEIKPIPGTEKLAQDEIIDIVGKPFSDPFQIYTFEIQPKIIKILQFNSKQIKKKGLDKFGIDSAYCNGNNYLYISGGIDQVTSENIGLFWAIDLKGKNFGDPLEMNPKKNHSMIYSERKVYIIGGEDTYTMIYDTEKKEINQWESLNYKRFEPSLIKHNNYLFCFDTSKKYSNDNDNDFNFEKIDLYSKNAKWEVVTPRRSPNLRTVFCQKFFGVVEDYRQNIIFVGGIYDKENNLEDDECTNLQYNTNTNTIEKSDIEFEDISFSEKTFLAFDNKTYYILPNFNKHSPKIIYFKKDTNSVEVKPYHRNSRFKKNNNVKMTRIKPSLDGLNFDMPKNEESSDGNYFNNQNTSKKFDNKDNNLINNNYNNYIEEEKNNEIEGGGIKIQNISKIEPNNDNQTIISNKDNININNIEDKDEKEEKNINIDENININAETKVSEKKKMSEEVEPEPEPENNKEKEEEKNKELKEEIDKEKDNDENIKKSTKEEVDIKQYNNFDVRDNCNNGNNKENISKEKLNIETSNNVKKIIYFEKRELLTKYHSSLDDHFNTNVYSNNVIKNLKKRRNVPPPIDINPKTLKKQIKKINKTQYNEFIKNKNY